jgi:hypothetical protein
MCRLNAFRQNGFWSKVAEPIPLCFFFLQQKYFSKSEHAQWPFFGSCGLFFSSQQGAATLRITTPSIMAFCKYNRKCDTQYKWHSDTQHDDIQHDDTQHVVTQHDDTDYDDTQHVDTQHDNIQHDDTHYVDT